jgi:hypothetical protein
MFVIVTHIISFLSYYSFVVRFVTKPGIFLSPLMPFTLWRPDNNTGKYFLLAIELKLVLITFNTDLYIVLY